ncbi:MAG: TonB family protein [Pseudotabrizicola sp.]|uniref:energy transducer TonB n=1 Tax=Pseudotabrizicola sp. TaxID=2939647 RepID=UPI0027207F3C|nr:TonB family protein [Pseudotabrizicola sp.]MDO9639960.1 TonB family protein [Pseudotabrizicola sp.]
MKHPRLPFVIALALSGALHAAAAIAIAPQPDEFAVEGGGAATVALLGEAFEDLAQGATPVAATEAPPAPPLGAVPVTTQVAATAPPLTATPAPPLLLPPSETADLAAMPPVDNAPAVQPELAPQVPAALAAAAVAAPPELATPVETASSAPDTSPRPPARAEAPAKPVEKRAVAQSTPVPAGNADRNARKGAQMGQEKAAAAAATGGSGAQTAQAGNAARSSYPGLVLRKIERTRKAATQARGTVVVVFRVAPSGGLASARVAKSTGDASLERAALDHIRRAAPFPAPPAGAETDFRFEFVGRR